MSRYSKDPKDLGGSTLLDEVVNGLPIPVAREVVSPITKRAMPNAILPHAYGFIPSATRNNASGFEPTLPWVSGRSRRRRGYQGHLSCRNIDSLGSLTKLDSHSHLGQTNTPNPRCYCNLDGGMAKRLKSISHVGVMPLHFYLLGCKRWLWCQEDLSAL